MKVKIGMEIRSLSKYISRYLNHIQGQYDLTGAQGLILAYIYESETDVYQRDIEKYFNIRRSSATGLITSLEKNDYITKRSIEYDARIKKLILTDKAINVISLVEQQVSDLENQMLKDINNDDLKTFKKVIKQITNNLTEDKKNG